MPPNALIFATFNAMRFLRFLLPLALLIGPLQAAAPKYAYVDTEYILQHLPEYAEAQKELNSLANGWLDEIEEKYEAANQLEVAYRAERVLLTPEMRRKREDEIAGKRSDATDMQKAKFGVEESCSRSARSSSSPSRSSCSKSSRTWRASVSTWSSSTRPRTPTCCTPTRSMTSRIG